MKGCHEVIERDAVMLTWYRKLTHPQIDPKSDKILKKIFEERFEYHTLDYTLLFADVGLDIPTIICVVVDEENTSCKFVMGAASNLDPVSAAIKSLLEASGQGRPYLKYLVATRKVNLDNFTELKDFPDTLVFYASEKILNTYHFFFHLIIKLG